MDLTEWENTCNLIRELQREHPVKPRPLNWGHSTPKVKRTLTSKASGRENVMTQGTLKTKSSCPKDKLKTLEEENRRVTGKYKTLRTKLTEQTAKIQKLKQQNSLLAQTAARAKETKCTQTIETTNDFIIKEISRANSLTHSLHLELAKAERQDPLSVSKRRSSLLFRASTLPAPQFKIASLKQELLSLHRQHEVLAQKQALSKPDAAESIQVELNSLVAAIEAKTHYLHSLQVPF